MTATARGRGRRRPRSRAGRVPVSAWGPLVLHSYRLGAAGLARCVRERSARHLRAALYRLLVPVEPWRYWELGRLVPEPFAGRCLDVGSPKLLASLLDRRGRGSWTAVDLFSEEIARWRALDPALDLRVEDARALPFGDASFDRVVCVSVIEHVPGDGDTRAMEEMWRVLRPGGVLHLTTNVARRAEDIVVDEPVYGEASAPADGGVFFERRYTEEEVRARLLGLPWEELVRERVRERRPVHGRFFAARPWSFPAGGLLALACPGNFAPVADASELDDDEFAVMRLTLRRPA